MATAREILMERCATRISRARLRETSKDEFWFWPRNGDSSTALHDMEKLDENSAEVKTVCRREGDHLVPFDTISIYKIRLETARVIEKNKIAGMVFKQTGQAEEIVLCWDSDNTPVEVY